MNIQGKASRSILLAGMGALLLGVLPFLAGCQLSQNGQTLPSPDYLDNKIQYFPAGNEFQYQQEMDRIKREQADRELSQTGIWQQQQ